MPVGVWEPTARVCVLWGGPGRLPFSPSHVGPVFSLLLRVRAPAQGLRSYFGSVPVTLDRAFAFALPLFARP